MNSLLKITAGASSGLLFTEECKIQTLKCCDSREAKMPWDKTNGSFLEHIPWMSTVPPHTTIIVAILLKTLNNSLCVRVFSLYICPQWSGEGIISLRTRVTDGRNRTQVLWKSIKCSSPVSHISNCRTATILKTCCLPTLSSTQGTRKESQVTFRI